MTFIRSEKNSTLLFAALIFILISTIVALIMFYNQTVNLKHGITDLKTDIQQAAAETASLKDRVFGIFDPQKVDALAKEQGLVKETRPSYIEVNSWVLASHL
jgi:cell division protein FtsL